MLLLLLCLDQIWISRNLTWLADMDDHIRQKNKNKKFTNDTLGLLIFVLVFLQSGLTNLSEPDTCFLIRTVHIFQLRVWIHFSPGLNRLVWMRLAVLTSWSGTVNSFSSLCIHTVDAFSILQTCSSSETIKAPYLKIF